MVDNKIEEQLDEMKVNRFSIDENHILSMTKAFARDWLLDQASVAQDFVYTLRTRANELAHIHSLPVLKDRCYAIVTLTAVCRKWRAMGLDSPLLWTDIDALNLDRAEVFLRRSGTTAAHVRLYAIYQEGAEYAARLADILSDHVEHITSLTLSARLPLLSDILTRITFSLGAIQNLSLEAWHYTFSLHDSITPTVFTPTITKQLDNISLYGVFLPFNSPMFVGLLTLHLGYHNPRPELAPSMDEFLAVLKNCPHLTDLRLCYAGPTVDTLRRGGTTPVVRRLELSCLQTLSLELEARNIALLLTHLVISEHTRVNLTCYLEESDSVTSIIPPHSTLMVLNVCRTLRVRAVTLMHERRSAMLKYIRVEAAINSMAPPNITIDLASADRWNENHWQAITPEVLLALPVLFHTSPISTLDVSCNANDMTCDQWLETLERFPLLTSLTLHPQLDGLFALPSCVNGLLDALCVLNHEALHEPATICSGLRYLMLDRFVMDSEFFPNLLGCLELRSSMGIGLCAVDILSFHWTGPGKLLIPDLGEWVYCRKNGCWCTVGTCDDSQF
ncbi:unnamed protein product [Somion occarium]|uniref:F-box domain-containing protein n=1 Tax=Somion occarium TaxID=3059160 RepID=A0ABP1DUW5_9APHY